MNRGIVNPTKLPRSFSSLGEIQKIKVPKDHTKISLSQNDTNITSLYMDVAVSENKINVRNTVTNPDCVNENTAMLSHSPNNIAGNIKTFKLSKIQKLLP